MYRIHCEIIKDLLPLYVEDVCSEKSKSEIEKHLKECEGCRKYYELLKDATPEVVIKKESDFFREIQFIQKIKKKITIKMLTTGFVVFLVCVVLPVICFVPFPKKIDGTFPTLNQDAQDTIVTVKGTYYNYLIRKDKFDGVLIDETGFEYPAMGEESKISKSTIKDEEALPIHFVYDDGKKVLFATAWFKTDLSGIHYCVFID